MELIPRINFFFLLASEPSLPSSVAFPGFLLYSKFRSVQIILPLSSLLVLKNVDTETLKYVDLLLHHDFCYNIYEIIHFIFTSV